jgi:multimeric flavodoxin WrbA
MRICVLSGNPKKDGRCQSVIDAAVQGALEGGAQAEEIRLCGYGLKRCNICKDGWGTCREKAYCSFGSDGFDDIKEKVKACDALILATPVYWSETSEALKCFMDRFRRCCVSDREALNSVQTLLIASAGGSGNGILACLEQMERFCRHTGAEVFDYIGVNRWNTDYKAAAAKEAARAMALGRKNGDTV